MRVIVAGVLEFPPETMHESLLAARAHIEGAYTEQGCVHYAWTEDPLNPGRVYVFEEWDTIEDLDAHLNDHWYTDMGAHDHSDGRQDLRLCPTLQTHRHARGSADLPSTHSAHNLARYRHLQCVHVQQATTRALFREGIPGHQQRLLS